MKAKLGAMKTIIVALIASCVVSLAQTNTYNSDSTLDNNAPLDTTRKLLDAAKSGDVKTVKLLLEKGADVNTKSDDGGTALMSAAKRGYMEIIKLLFEKGADVNAKRKDGTTALMLALVLCNRRGSTVA
jgi:ankyrin repeat protein